MYNDPEWTFNEPYQIYTAPWNDEIVLMDDGANDKVQLLNAEVEFIDGGRKLITADLPDGATVNVYVDGYGHTYNAIVRNPE
jgi:hypothetical protein